MVWAEDDLTPALEDWRAVMADLPGNLSGRAVKRLRTEGGIRYRPWPWVPLFEEEQLQDLIAKAADLGALAELAEDVQAEEVFRDLGVPSHRYVLAHSSFATKLPDGALAWLMYPRPHPLPPPLDLPSSGRLWRAAGHRESEALEARLEALKAALRIGEIEAVLDAADEPDLWGRGEFLAELADWMCARGSLADIGSDVADRINRSLNGVPSHYPEEPSLKLIHELDRNFLSRAARLLSPSLHDEVQRATLLETVLRALAQGSEDAGCWQELEAEVARSLASDEAGGPHPLAELARQIRELPPGERWAIRERGWATFAAAAQRFPGLLGFHLRSRAILPAFDLAASLSYPGGWGSAALQVIDHPGSRGQRWKLEWWMGIVSGLRTWQRRSGAGDPEDRDDAALGLIRERLSELGEKEWELFEDALEREHVAFPQWSLPTEFGVGER
jgi:hypothetical protein